MKRIFVLVGTWTSIVVVAGQCLAADPKRPGNQPVVPAWQQSASPGGGLRNVNPPNNGRNVVDTNRRAAEARRAAAAQQAAAAAKATRNATATNDAAATQNSNNQPSQSYYRNQPYGYGNNSYYSSYGYSPYGYSPYGYSYAPYGYIPPGTTPFVLGYNLSTGATFLYPYGGSYSPNYSQYAYPYRYYQNPYLGYGYPAAVFVPADQLYGIGPIQQLMGVGPWFQ